MTQHRAEKNVLNSMRSSLRLYNLRILAAVCIAAVLITESYTRWNVTISPDEYDKPQMSIHSQDRIWLTGSTSKDIHWITPRDESSLTKFVTQDSTQKKQEITTSTTVFSENATESLPINCSYKPHGLKLQTNSCEVIEQLKYLNDSTYPVTLLASFPGSGNTWTRLLLSSLTGIFTGDVYKDKQFAQVKGFSYRKDNTVVAVKTHYPAMGGKLSTAQRAIVLIRHPQEAIISYFNYNTLKSHVKVNNEKEFIDSPNVMSCKFKRFYSRNLATWKKWLDYWLNNFSGSVHLMFYETMKSCLSSELLKVNDFLGLPLNRLNFDCLLVSENRQKLFLRKSSLNKTRLFDVETAKATKLAVHEAVGSLESWSVRENKDIMIPEVYLHP